MDRDSRSELVKTIEAQKEKIHKYETKLRDLIQAYRGLLKEKEALEASVKALSVAQSLKGSKDVTVKDVKKKEPQDNGSSKEQVLSDDEESEEKETVKADNVEEKVATVPDEGDENEELCELRRQLATLSTSLSTVMHEKSKMEANYISEKKKLRTELEDQERMYSEETTAAQQQIGELSEEVKEYQSKVRLQQNEREKEQTDHAIMLKELQKLVAEERMAKEHIENQLDEVRQALTEQQNSVRLRADHEASAGKFKQEVEDLKAKLKACESKASEPSPMLLKLQKELVDVKAEHRASLQQEQQKVSESQSLISAITLSSEDRISKLETKLSDLSEVAGNYERLRNQDQATILKLRERVTQLDLENSALADKACGIIASKSGANHQEEELQLEEIVDKMVELKAQLKIANQKSDKPVNIHELLEQLGSEQDLDTLHSKCKQDFNALKEEFERYKLRAQSVLKSKSVKDNTVSVEVETLRTQVNELKERVRQLRSSEEELLEQLRSKEEHFSKSLLSIGEKHRTDLHSQDALHKQKLGELEAEIRRHRERTIALLAEKDSDIERLRSVPTADKLETQYLDSFGGVYRQSSAHSPQPHLSEVGAASSDEGRSAISELLSRSSFLSGSGIANETALLHFSQEQARKDVEINTLRRQKHSVEGALRELQHNSLLKAEQLNEKIEELNEQIRKLERNKSRESANLEYLKNVVYHYMVTFDVVAKQQMLNAISTILEFSPKERRSVQSVLNSGWWAYGQNPKGKKH